MKTRKTGHKSNMAVILWAVLLRSIWRQRLFERWLRIDI